MEVCCKIHDCLGMLFRQIYHTVIVSHLRTICRRNDKYKYILPVLLHVHPEIHIIFLTPILNTSRNRFAAFYQ